MTFKNKPKVYDPKGICIFFKDNFNYELTDKEAEYISELITPKCEEYLVLLESSSYSSLREYIKSLNKKV